MSEEKKQNGTVEGKEQAENSSAPKAWYEPWLEAALGAVFMGTIASLAAVFLFDGDYIFQIGAVGAGVAALTIGLRGVIFYALVFFIMIGPLSTIFL